MKTEKAASQIDKEHIWHPFTSFADEREQLLIKKASGLYLYTEDGRAIMDAISSWWVNVHGHSHPAIARAIYQQASTLEHVIFAGFTHEPAIELTRNLLSVFPPGLQRVFFSDNGSTAVEVAIKMSLQFFANRATPRKRIIALKGAYHGDTFGAMSVGSRSEFTAPFNDHLFDVDFIDVPHEHNFAEVYGRFKHLCAGGDVASFIYEPLVQGAAGMVMYESWCLNALMREAHGHGVLCIADEVFSGFGRTGKWFASLYLDEQPDILAISKGITGGTLPLGATACTQNVVNAFTSSNPMHTFFHGHSYTANPIACAAANASFQLLSADEPWDTINMISKCNREFLQKIAKHTYVADARSLGTILAIEVATQEGTSYFNALNKKIYAFFLERNILLRPLGNVIYIVPPYAITEEELRAIYSAIEEFLDSLQDDSR
jgi:adenosylmethionine---8-amino-7-oxononanoate aminotransferase